ncbi:MAG: diguanylate cyclase [Thermoanaerobaculaceae bacterium]|nr:diguanylate cyclase [Thermoanaerobaculaceae bacterium]
METLAVLGRWSIGVQLAVVSVIAIFFLFLSRTSKLEEVRLWAAAWIADAVALLSVFVYAIGFVGGTMPPVATGVYAAAKTLFVLLLVAGTRHHFRSSVEDWLRPKQVALIVGVWGLTMGVLASQLAYAQVAQSLLVGVLMTTAGVWVLRKPRGERSRWLGVAFLVEGLVFLQYVPSLAPQIWGAPVLFNYVRYSSFFDAVAELLIALASLVALQDRIVEELRYANEELVASQERLRQLVDLDPLTSLMNRRGFRRELARVETAGAAIIFLDINNYKSINDRLGHSVGDACLRRFARVLTQCFRAEDAHFRWGGDEFLVLAPGLDIDGSGRRVAQLCSQLAQPEGDIPTCGIAVGVALLATGDDATAALHEADARMYIDKRRMGVAPATSS